MAEIAVVLWVCPTPGCGNYYGTSGTGDLTKILNKSITNNPTFPRSTCPDCHRFGRGTVERIPVTTTVKVPDAGEQISSTSDQETGSPVS